MNTKIRFLLSALISVVAISACSNNDSSENNGEESQATDGGNNSQDAGETAENEATLGGFLIQVEPETASITITSPDGKPLIEGLGKGTVTEDEIPLTGFAVREITMSYEMKFGAFKPTDTAKGSWKPAESLEMKTSAEKATVTLFDKEKATIATLELTASEEGHLKIEAVKGDGKENRLSIGYACAESDHFMGFGAQTWDVDHRGFTVPTWVQEQGIGKVEHDDYTGVWFMVGRRHASHLPIPEYLSSRGYIMAVDTNLRATFALCSEDSSAARVEFEMPASLHIFYGETPQKAIERATLSFGRPRMPPDFAFAPWLDAIYGSENVRRIAAKIREEQIPASVIWTEDWRGADWDGDNYVLKEEWELDRTLYPDFEALAQELHGDGFKFLVYFNTFVYKDTKAWEETAGKGYLIKDRRGNPYVFTGHKMTDSSLIDLSNPDGRAWALSKLKLAVELGADGWMGDFAEWMPTDAQTYAGSGLSQHNLHPVQWQEVQREALDTAGDDVDRLLFARSGWIGTPALADVVWAGDQRTTFDEDDGMPTILPIGIGLGIVGISTYGHDIAGYQSATNDPSTKELYFRWTELGAWSPVMRTHHGYQAKLNWNWEKDDETIAHFKRYAKLHIALAPYWKGLAKLASETGFPIWRGLAVMFPDDAKAWPVKDQVMVGDKIMIAPIATAGTTARKLYLPAGNWYNWNDTGGTISGKTEITANAELTEIPVFANAGAIVPMYQDGIMTLANETDKVQGQEKAGANRLIKIFLGDNGSFNETDGVNSYTLSCEASIIPAGDASYKYEGKELNQCKENSTESCFENISGHNDKIHVTGNGTLEISINGKAVSSFTAKGSDNSRKLILDIRR